LFKFFINTSFSHCYSYSSHLVIKSYFSFFPSHFSSIEQMLILMLAVLYKVTSIGALIVMLYIMKAPFWMSYSCPMPELWHLVSECPIASNFKIISNHVNSPFVGRSLPLCLWTYSCIAIFLKAYLLLTCYMLKQRHLLRCPIWPAFWLVFLST